MILVSSPTLSTVQSCEAYSADGEEERLRKSVYSNRVCHCKPHMQPAAEIANATLLFSGFTVI